MPNIYLIHPVRGHERSETEGLVRDWENAGWTVYWPIRDTNQDTPELDINHQNLAGIKKADMVAIFWDGVSKGSLFDAGMAFALGKPLHIVEIPPKTEEKSYPNMFMKWARYGAHKDTE